MVKFSRVNGKFIVLALAMLLFSAFGCGQEDSKGTSGSGSSQALAGGEFNKFFPKKGGEFDVVFTQEKTGMAQAKLKKQGQEVAMLTVSDTAGNPSAAEKFKSSTTSIAGYPSADSGSFGSVILVGNRFQVQVRSQGDDFTQSDREAWLQKFDLGGLARLGAGN